MLGERVDALQLPQMVKRNTDSLKTAFCVTVDHINTTTGISAQDRCTTINALANPKTKAQDFNRPGHVFPLCYHPGGVSARPGHTEASIDLCILAGKEPVAVIAEITLDNGKMARRNDLIPWARKWGFPIVTISELIEYKRLNN